MLAFIKLCETTCSHTYTEAFTHQGFTSSVIYTRESEKQWRFLRRAQIKYKPARPLSFIIKLNRAAVCRPARHFLPHTHTQTHKKEKNNTHTLVM